MALAAKDVTLILAQVQAGEPDAAGRLFDAAYDELRSLAASLMHSERADHTLEATALVHEGVLRLLGDAELPTANRRIFFGAVVQAMRRVLIDHARRRNAARRGGHWERQPLDDTLLALERTHQVDLLALDEQLAGLETAAPRAAEVVTLRFFGGLENREIAEHLGVSLSAVEKDWRFARAWLHRRLGEPR